MRTKRADSVIFDFDGVIADTIEDVWASVEYASEIVGGIMDRDFMKDTSHVALPEEELLRHVRPYPGIEKLEAFCSAVRIHYRTMNPFEKTRLYPGLEEIFHDLGMHGIPWTVVSSKPQEALRRLLKVKGWEQLIPVSYSLDSIPGADNKASVYRYLMGGMFASRHPVCVGDTWTDITAARSCGLPVIAVLYGDGNTKALLAEHPDCTADTGWKLREILGQVLYERKREKGSAVEI